MTRAGSIRLVAALVALPAIAAILQSAAAALRTALDHGYFAPGLRALALELLVEELRLGAAQRFVADAVALAVVVAALAGAAVLARRGASLRDASARIPVRPVIAALALLLVAVGAVGARVAWWRSQADGPNVVVIVIDTLRADHLGAYGYEHPTSPHFDAFAARSHLFTRALSSSSWTRPAVASLLTSKTPAEHGILSEERSHALAPRFVTLQERLRSRGYRTHALLSNPHYVFGLDQRFGRVDYLDDAETIYSRAIEAVRRGPRPFFLLVHNTDPHDRYEPHEGFGRSPASSPHRSLEPLLPVRSDDGSRRAPSFDSPENRRGIVRLAPRALAELVANYDAEIEYVDHHLGRFLDALERDGLLDDTIVVVTSDHGEEFLDHGSYWHGGTLFDELLRVPLLIRVPGLGSGVVDAPVATIDVVPTLEELLGSPPEPGAFSGRSLAPLLRGEPRDPTPVLSATAMRSRPKLAISDRGWKLIRYADGEVIGLYDLTRDPGERRDVSRENPDRLRELEALLAERWNVAAPRGEAAPLEIDAATRARLRDLGYTLD